jgi:hypothetical protein
MKSILKPLASAALLLISVNAFAGYDYSESGGSIRTQHDKSGRYSCRCAILNGNWALIITDKITNQSQSMGPFNGEVSCLYQKEVVPQCPAPKVNPNGGSLG